ncbi:methane monooxygenase/ammonia monooxygenase subunit B [Rhodococcus sp. WAY2]|uniref:methane monooxygenase/ammonia monooxygenase subunit B n=1 Tax=Rhodococcus sp. WAY2 TaxID=2663121 RepID=UPI001359F0A1|nr:methane monooxygenase/ammonia monooxygenase subunit B [Rhodococcus sp. WAY2]
MAMHMFRINGAPPRNLPRLGLRRKRLTSLLGVVGFLFLLTPPPIAAAHGEQSQQAFERTSTILFYDTHFSTQQLNIGEDLTITGTMRVMNAWPDHTIKPPELGFLTVNQPGPQFFIEDREMSGMFTPQSVKVVKGGVYPYKMVLKARLPGTWHIHPAMAMEGTGTLVGAGQDITINDVGTFAQPQTLSDGRTVDLATFGLSRVTTWHVIGLVLGVLYLAYWLRKSILQRAMVVGGGRASTLVSRRDLKVGVAFAGVAMLIGTAGFAYATTSDGPHVPLQVARYEPVPEAPSSLASHMDTKVDSAVFQEDTGKLVMKIQVRNNADSAINLDHLQFADYEVFNKDLAAQGMADGQNVATVSPSAAIEPGASRDLTIELDARELAARNLLPLNEAQIRLTGLMFFRDASGQESAAEINEMTSGILPQFG